MYPPTDALVVTGNPFIDVDYDAAPLYVDARTSREFDVALERNRLMDEGDLARGRLFRALDMSGWQNNRPQRWPARAI